MAPTLSFFSLTILSLLFLQTLSPRVQASNGGFSVELIHRDSPKSPFYNPNETPYQRISNALHRSQTRIHRFQEPTSEILPNDGDYLMNISIGTPPIEIIAIADTGSDLIWTQCRPCVNCYVQDQPLFDPNSSSTYKDLSCTTQACQHLPHKICRTRDPKCRFAYNYMDQSHTSGNLAGDTITLSSTSGRPVSFPAVAFGCAHDSGGDFSRKGSGIVGLGGGSLSLVSQMGHSVDRKFSYCLVPYFSFSQTGRSSTLHFGSSSVPQGPGVQTTPLLSGEFETFYYLSLESFSVGNTTVKMSSSLHPSQSDHIEPCPNIVIDSGTTITRIPEDVLRNLSDVVDKLVDAKHAKDPHRRFSLCYTRDSFKGAPTIVAHFSGGADVELGNTFVLVSDTVVCFAFFGKDPSSKYPSIFGNLSQMNYLVAYDLKGRTVSFKRTDCSKE